MEGDPDVAESGINAVITTPFRRKQDTLVDDHGKKTLSLRGPDITLDRQDAMCRLESRAGEAQIDRRVATCGAGSELWGRTNRASKGTRVNSWCTRTAAEYLGIAPACLGSSDSLMRQERPPRLPWFAWFGN